MTITSQQNVYEIVKRMNESSLNLEKAVKEFNEVYQRERLVFTTAAAQLSVICAQEKRDAAEPI